MSRASVSSSGYVKAQEFQKRCTMKMDLIDEFQVKDKLEQNEAELRRVTRDREQSVADRRHKDADVEKLELEITQLTGERDQLVRQLEKSQDMLFSFQQDLNLTENELKRVSGENKRLKEEAEKTENGVLESKEKEIRSLNDRIRAMEFDYDDALQKQAREKIKADKAEREVVQLQTKIEQLEADLKGRRRMSSDNKDLTAKFDVEIARLTKERDVARTELQVCKRDLEKIEEDLKRTQEINARLRYYAETLKAIDCPSGAFTVLCSFAGQSWNIRSKKPKTMTWKKG